MVRAGSCGVVRAVVVVVLVATGSLVGPLAQDARADNLPITDRNYAIDLYDGVAIGNTAIVGMGGAGAALINGTAGALINPSAIAVRQTTDLDAWNWDYHLDWLTGKYSSDYDNNGVAAGENSGASLVTFGLALRLHDWSVAATYLTQSAPVPGSAPALGASTTRVRVILGRYNADYDLAIGVGVQGGYFDLEEGDTTLFEVSGTGLILGATWLPRQDNLRIGGALDLAITGGEVKTSTCDPMSCRGYILPSEVEAPSRLVGGVAYRIGPTAWNQPINNVFRDEQAVTLAADVVLTGPTGNGYGLEAFGMQQLQRSGRNLALSLRGGAEYEWLPGKLRLRGGTYWEPSRFDGVGGRLHATLGAELAVWEFHLLGLRRLCLGFTGDVASRYRNVGGSIGFWH